MSDSYSDRQPPKSGIDSPNETNFNPKEAPKDKRRKFRRLWFYNEELRSDRTHTNSEEVRRREKNHILDSISSSLEIPEYQHREAQKIIEQSNFSDSVAGQYLSLETYCYAICVIVWNQNADFGSKVLPNKDNLEHFDRLQERLDISNEKLEQALEELEYDLVEDV